MMRIVIVAALAACSSSTPPRAARPSIATAALDEEPVQERLGIAPLVVYFSDIAELTMRGDGSVWPASRDQPLFTVHPDGRIIAPGGGRGELRADGRVVRPDGSVSQGVLEGDHLLLGGRTIELDERGILRLDGPAISGTPPRVEGIVDAPSRRTALLLVGMFLEAGLSGNTTN